MRQQIDKTQLIKMIKAAHARMDRLIGQLNVAQMNQPGAVGVWSVKDVLAHLAFWERYATGLIQATTNGSTPDLSPEDQTETYNASVVAQYYLRPLAGVMAEWHAAREDLLDALEDISDADLIEPDRFKWSNGIPLWRHVAGSSYAHEEEHIEQIQAWMDGVAGGES